MPDFGDFLSGASQCASKATIIGDDDVTKYVADDTSRKLNRDLSYYYQSFAPAPQSGKQDFYTDLKTLFPFENTRIGRSLDEHAALSYDAAEVIVTATEYLREGPTVIPVTPAAVWREITAIHAPSGGQQPDNVLDGVTGTIDYGGDITQHVPKDKPVAILRVTGGEVDPHRAGFCGTASGEPESTWCPATG